MVRTVCAIFIDFTQGKHVPGPCDCSDVDVVAPNNNNDNAVANETMFCVPDLYARPRWNDPRKDCPLDIGYDENQHSHGVTNHGNSRVKDLTERQRELIAKLRRQDL